MSVGSLTGSLLTARQHVVTMRWFFGSIVVMALAGFGLAWAPNLWLAYVWCVPFGLGGAAFVTGANAITQQECPPDMRSRLLALQAVAFLGSTPIGGPITGLIADNISAEWALAYGSVISLVCVAGRRRLLASREPQWHPRTHPDRLTPSRRGVAEPDGRHAGGMDRRARILITAGVVGALVAPVVLDRDGFPLSTYPMYSRARGEAVTFATAQAVDADGATSTLTLAVIGDSDDPLIVAGELRDAIRDGRADAAVRWRSPSGRPSGAVCRRRDARSRWSPNATTWSRRWRAATSLLERTVHASCEVPS